MFSTELFIDLEHMSAIPNFPQHGSWFLQLNPVDQDISNSRYCAMLLVHFTPTPVVIDLLGEEEDGLRFSFIFKPFQDPLISINAYVGALAPRYFTCTWYNALSIQDDMKRLQSDMASMKEQIQILMEEREGEKRMS